ncbi:PREDICTED: PR domain zinc finger protein 16-like [Miniopterus natalensis]|uniref:PR domain zinc finger protein 16-like n=1 Tax=Miniopterus natalensis TaxID=291302 RepID=UPI0007A6D39C|nr:PREDICTED: PR domain zinc finger protein 16-like [Miniopterus natalensis]
MRSKARARKLAKSDGDIVNNMYDPDPDLLAGESAEDETEDSIMSPIPMGPASPFPTSEDFTPKEGSPYEAPVYIPEDIPIPPDFELRESSIPGAGLGIWAKKRMEVGERFGPYMVAPRATLKEADFGWEQMLTEAEVSSQEGCVQKVGELLRPPLASPRASLSGRCLWPARVPDGRSLSSGRGLVSPCGRVGIAELPRTSRALYLRECSRPGDARS